MHLRNRASIIAALVALAASLVGCSSTPSPELPAPGMTAIYVRNHIEAPCGLAKIGISVDGELRYAAMPPHAPASGSEAKLVARVRLPSGTHVLSMKAMASCAAAPSVAEPQERMVTLRDARSFLVGAPPASIVIDLDSRAMGPDGAPRVDAAFRIQGGELAPGIGPEGVIYAGGEIDGTGIDDRHCTGMPASQRAICRAEAALVRARERNDVVSFQCINDKVTQMRSLALILVRARERAGAAPGGDGDAPPNDDTVQGQDASITAAAEERILRLAFEVENCIGSEVMSAGMDVPRVPEGANRRF